MRIKNLAMVFILFIPVTAFAQTAAELDLLLEADAVTTNVAARFVMGAAGLTATELSGAAANNAAYQTALSKGWVKGAPEDAINLQDTAFLMMNVFELKGGIMYSIFHNPRYAYREMIYKRLIPGRTYADMNLSGQRFLQILGRILNYTGEREEMDEILWTSGVFN
ncbi:MAG: hypothetical protein LBC52_07265 [Treponema sp.]|jgi:hypothetical protein|nr:hypothetical protein [Treponema sp.]